MLSLLSASPALPSPPDLRIAQERSASNARAAFRAAARDDNAQAFRLASLIAAEEQPLGDAEALCARLDARIDELADSARPRLQLAASFGGTADRNTIATAVSSTLFGAGGADARALTTPPPRATKTRRKRSGQFRLVTPCLTVIITPISKQASSYR